MLPAIRTTTTVSGDRLSAVFDRLFDDAFLAPMVPAATWTAMPLAAFEDEHAITVELDAPGVAEGDVEVSVRQNELVVRCERKSQCQGGGYDARTYGRFEQRVALSQCIDVAGVSAKLASGVLPVTCPKSEGAKPRRVAIQAG